MPRNHRWRNRQLGDPIEDRGEQPPWHSHLGQLERDVLRMPGHLSSDLHQLFSERRQRPMRNILRQCQPPRKVRQAVSQCKQLQPRLVVFKRATGELRPFDGVLSLLDPLLDMPITMLPSSHLLTRLSANEFQDGEVRS